MKKIFLSLTILITFNILFADMPQKQEQEQRQEQITSDDYLNSPEYAELLKEEQKQRAANQTSGASKADEQTDVHQRICPLCGSFSVNCPADQERIKHGNILRCGCSVCGGNGNN